VDFLGGDAANAVFFEDLADFVDATARGLLGGGPLFEKSGEERVVHVGSELEHLREVPAESVADLVL